MMAMRGWFSLLLWMAMAPAFAADLAGVYRGQLNGDGVTLTLSQSGTAISGSMVDSYQRYDVAGQVEGNRLRGTATEQSLGIQFELTGEIANRYIDLVLVVEMLGQRSEQSARFAKDGESLADAPTAGAAGDPVAAGDPALIGRWVHESSYQSGSGDSFFAANTRQSIVFLADGRVANGGADVSMSGDSYFGQSSGGGAGTDLRWETRDQHLFLVGTDNGRVQRVDLGRYYVEDGRMLITGNNGQKLLLTRD
jgi:hypothetical protein